MLKTCIQLYLVWSTLSFGKEVLILVLCKIKLPDQLVHCKAFCYWLYLVVWELMINWMSSSSQASNHDRLVFIGLMPINASKNDKCNWISEHLASTHCQLEIKWGIPDLYFFLNWWVYQISPPKQSLQCSKKEHHLKNSFKMRKGCFIFSLFSFLNGSSFCILLFQILILPYLMETDVVGEGEVFHFNLTSKDGKTVWRKMGGDKLSMKNFSKSKCGIF